MKRLTKRPKSRITANYPSQTPKERALDTLYACKDIFESDDSGLLEGSFYSDFMNMMDEYIYEVKHAYK